MTALKNVCLAALIFLGSALPALAQATYTFPSGTTAMVGKIDIPTCADTGGNHLNYSGTTLSCGTSSSGGGSGALTLVATRTASNSTDLQWLSLTGTEYDLRCNIQIATTNQDVLVRFSTDNSTFDAGASAYEWMATGVGTAGAFNAGGAAADTAIRIKTAGTWANTAPGYFTMNLTNLAGTTVHRFLGQAMYLENSGGKRFMNYGGSYLTGNSPVQGIQVIPGSGNITSGSCSLWSRQT